MSVMAYGGLRTVLDSRDETARQAARLAELQKMVMVVQRDFEQVVNRPIRDGFGDPQRPLLAPGPEGAAVEFTHGGWRNPTLARRSSLQRVAYEVDDGKLLRRTWNVLDRAQDSKSFSAPLCKKVTEIELRMLDNDGKWQTSWPPDASGGNDPGPVPRAIEFSVDLEDLGRVTRLFKIPQPVEVPPPQVGNP